VTPYPQAAPASDDFAASRAHLEAMLTRLGGAEMMTCAQDELEDYLTTDGRELNRLLMQDQLDARARREQRAVQVTGADQVVRRRAEKDRRRLLATTVGRVEVTRIAYRAPKAANLYPADAVLALPMGLYSYPLQRLAAYEVAAGAVRGAGEALERTTGQRIGTRQLMETAVAAATDARAFYAASTPPTAPSSDLLVLSCDCTGVNMLPEALREPPPPKDQTPAPPSAQLSDRTRTGRCRMACVTALYDATPAERTAADVLPATAAEREARRKGPRATARHVDASLEHSVAPMVTALFDQAERRDPDHRRRWIVLVDGANHQLDCLQREAAARGVHIDIIVDFVHVIEYLWKAAEDLHAAQPSRTAFVHSAARTLLEGHAPQVIADLRHHLRQRTEAGLSSPGLQRATDYLTAKQPYLGYDTALALGWPIATGVIEGCCRYLVKDRLDVTGARWSLDGAEAVLLLRAVIANGDFETYWKFHLRHEFQRTHASRYQGDFAPAA
jgi:hypothetical protein